MHDFFYPLPLFGKKMKDVSKEVEDPFKSRRQLQSSSQEVSRSCYNRSQVMVFRTSRVFGLPVMMASSHYFVLFSVFVMHLVHCSPLSTSSSTQELSLPSPHISQITVSMSCTSRQ